MIGRLHNLDHAVGVDDRLALGDQLVSRFEVADDLIECVTGSFHGGVPDTVWTDVDSHSPWSNCRVPRQC